MFMRVQSLVFVACVGLSATAVAQSALKVEWAWKRAHQCSTTSPPLAVADIPADTKLLQIKMVDLGFRQFDHGGGSVAHGGESAASIPSGALKDYRGPCPMRNLYYGSEYEFTVRALAADGKTVLAEGGATRTYSTSVIKE
jgi:phosphatidylethanolamine-binding protein (PEBP) family uncharacterized protein